MTTKPTEGDSHTRPCTYNALHPQLGENMTTNKDPLEKAKQTLDKLQEQNASLQKQLEAGSVLEAEYDRLVDKQSKTSNRYEKAAHARRRQAQQGPSRLCGHERRQHRASVHRARQLGHACHRPRIERRLLRQQRRHLAGRSALLPGPGSVHPGDGDAQRPGRQQR